LQCAIRVLSVHWILLVLSVWRPKHWKSVLQVLKCPVVDTACLVPDCFLLCEYLAPPLIVSTCVLFLSLLLGPRFALTYNRTTWQRHAGRRRLNTLGNETQVETTRGGARYSHRRKQSGTVQTITGKEVQGNRGNERQGLQNKRQNKTQNLRIMTEARRDGFLCDVRHDSHAILWHQDSPACKGRCFFLCALGKSVSNPHSAHGGQCAAYAEDKMRHVEEELCRLLSSSVRHIWQNTADSVHRDNKEDAIGQKRRCTVAGSQRWTRDREPLKCCHVNGDSSG